MGKKKGGGEEGREEGRRGEGGRKGEREEQRDGSMRNEWLAEGDKGGTVSLREGGKTKAEATEGAVDWEG